MKNQAELMSSRDTDGHGDQVGAMVMSIRGGTREPLELRTKAEPEAQTGPHLTKAKLE